MKVTQTEYGTSQDILFNLDPYTARPIMVESTGISADANGRKIVKAGSILNKSGVIVNDATAKYVLLKDVDVTFGDAAGAGVYRGTLDLTKIETITEVTISADAQIALKGIIFMSNEDCDYVGGYTDNDASALAVRVTAIEGVVGDVGEGLVRDLDALETTVGALGLVVSADTTGLVDRVEALEQA